MLTETVEPSRRREPSTREDDLFGGYYRAKKVLVTGGASFIGSHLVELILRAGGTVTVADDLSSGKLENLSACEEHVELLRGDLREPEFCRRAASGNEVIFHLAAAHGGRGYIDSHPVECLNNMTLDHEVFTQAARAGASKIVSASSACVYPTNLQASATERLLLAESDANFDEPGKAFADGEYGWAKLMGEMQLRSFHKQFGIAGVACRIFTAYGERENESHAVIALIAKALNRLDPYPIWGDGLQTRNFTYVADTVWGMALAGATLDGFQSVNVGSSRHHTILELLEIIFEHVRWRPRSIERQLDKPVGVQSRASDNSAIQTLMGWQPHVDLKEGVERTVDWYMRSNPAGGREALDRRLMERI